LLSLVIDGELPADIEGQVGRHVAGCEVCERFGGEFAAVVAALRGAGEPETLNHDVVSRLQARLARDLR
jgi:anti-sigma factor RsiW